MVACSSSERHGAILARQGATPKLDETIRQLRRRSRITTRWGQNGDNTGHAKPTQLQSNRRVIFPVSLDQGRIFDVSPMLVQCECRVPQVDSKSSVRKDVWVQVPPPVLDLESSFNRSSSSSMSTESKRASISAAKCCLAPKLAKPQAKSNAASVSGRLLNYYYRRAA